MNHFSRLIHDVLPHAREDIENFQILAEEQIGNRYKLLVRVRVNEKLINEKLREMGLFFVEGPPIRVLFLVSQIESPKGEIACWWTNPTNGSDLTPTELALHRVFQERGFQPINRLMNLPDVAFPEEIKEIDLSDEGALKWGNIFSADVVISGKCEIVPGDEVSIFLKALAVKTGVTLYQERQTDRIEEHAGGTEKIVQSIERTISRMMVKLGPLMIKTAEASEIRINQCEIVLEGLRKFKQIGELKDFLLKNIAGVQSVIQTRAEGNSISLAVRFAGDVDKFVTMISGHEKFPFPAEIKKEQADRIRIQLR